MAIKPSFAYYPMTSTAYVLAPSDVTNVPFQGHCVNDGTNTSSEGSLALGNQGANSPFDSNGMSGAICDPVVRLLDVVPRVSQKFTSTTYPTGGNVTINTGTISLPISTSLVFDGTTSSVQNVTAERYTTFFSQGAFNISPATLPMVQFDVPRDVRFISVGAFLSTGLDSTVAEIQGIDTQKQFVTETVPIPKAAYGANALITSSKKTYLFVFSVKIIAQAEGFGIGNVLQAASGYAIGLPYYVPSANYITAVYFDGALLPNDRPSAPSANHYKMAPADTNTPTASTSDVRGKIRIADTAGTSIPFDGVKRVTVYGHIPGATMGDCANGNSSSQIGIFGQNQYSTLSSN